MMPERPGAPGSVPEALGGDDFRDNSPRPELLGREDAVRNFYKIGPEHVLAIDAVDSGGKKR